MKKKLTQFRWLVTMLLLVTAMAMPKMAWAEITPTKPSSGDGTSGSPYQIGTKAELYWFAALVNGDKSAPEVSSAKTGACATLTADITVNTGVLNENGTLNNNGSGLETWTPIGNSESYTGTFDGQGHTISGLYFNNSENNAVGLFGGNSGTIKNVGVVDSYFYGYDYVGGVCVLNENGTITGCYNTGTVSGNSEVGGVCGHNDGGTITGCYNTGTVSGSGYYVGGVCGSNFKGGTITGCYTNNGGVCGYDEGTITDDCGVKSDNEFRDGTVCSLLNTALKTAKASVRFYKGRNYPELIKNLPSLVGDVYQISNKEELYAFAQLVNNGETNAKAVLTKDIIVNTDVLKSDGTLNNNGSGFEPWTPIGFSFPYEGTFDGQGHTISGLYFKDVYASHVGLFSYSSGTIRNVGVIDSYFEGSNYIGGVCGYNHAEGDNSTATIENCYNTGTVSGSGSNVGGVCGYNHAEGEYSTVTIENCYNTGTVSGYDNVGGVCGYNHAKSDFSTVTIENCYNTGTVSCNGHYAGGVCGYNYAEGEYSTATIENCYNTGTVSGSGSNVGGVCGANQALDNCTAPITNCYYNSEKYTGNAVGSKENVEVYNVEGKTTAQFMSGEVCYLMNNGITDGTLTWHQNIDMEGATKDPYPVLDNTHGVVYQCSVCTSAYSNTEGAKGAHDYVDDGNGFLTCKACGTKSYQPATQNASNQYEISNAGQLYWFAALVNGELGGETQKTSANAVLTANITVNSGVLNKNGTLNNSGFIPWTPIGNDQNPFTGTFDGQGHTISGLYFNDVDASYVGLFGINSGTIKNVGVVDSYFYGNEYVGGVCGRNDGGTITGCYNTGSVSVSGSIVGGVCGLNGGRITGCYNIGTVSGNNQVGGVCGKNIGTITGCYNTELVSGNNQVGGVCGENGSTITGCYNTGTVNGYQNYVGGVCGYNYVTITGCYNSGEVSGNEYVGGVCGYNGGIITGCYTNNEIVCGNNNSNVTDCGENTNFTNGTVCPLLNKALKKVNASVRFYKGANYPELIMNVPSLAEGVYQISNKEELYAFALVVNKNVETSANAVLTADITVNTGVLKSDGTLNNNGSGFETWTPIGNDQNPYTGTFDGQVHTISGLYFNHDYLDYVGLFGSNSGTIKNVGVVDSYFCGNDYVGGVCGKNGKTITGCYNIGTVSGSSNVGGVCGSNFNGGTITNCYYLASNDDGNGGKTTDQFKSGEVCYLLSQGSTVTDGENTTYYSGSVWGQQLGTDDYPVLSDYKVIKAAKGDKDANENDTYWSTFSNLNSDVTLSVPSDRTLKVYNATVSSGTMTLKKRTDNQVAKGEGVLLKTDGEYVNVKANETNGLHKVDYANNNLMATPATEKTINAEAGYTLYRLTYNKVSTKEGLGFYLGLVKDANGNVTSSNGSELKATPGKAYLKVSTGAATNSANAALARGFVFPGDDETTGIGEIVIEGDAGISGSANANDRIYNLQGQQVTAPAKGLYIKNNKKVIIK